MSTEIYYFSGTGNSLYIAKELCHRLPDAVMLPIVRALTEEKIVTSADMIGIVFPIYALSYPTEIKEFIERLEYNSPPYIFAVASRKCRPRVFADMNELFSRKGGKISATQSVEMPENYLPVFDVNTPEEAQRMTTALSDPLDLFCNKVVDRENSIEEGNKLPSYFALLYLLVRFFSYLNKKTRYFNLENKFYATSDCTGCGRCQEVCLANRIKLNENAPSWDKENRCRLCLACIHFCPAHAIQIRGARTDKKGRYHHQSVTAEEIARQK